MTPGARLQASVELTDLIWASNLPMDRVASDYFRTRRHIGSKDRNDIANRVYSMMRHHARLSWWAARLGNPTVRFRTFLHVLLVEKTSLAELTTLCTGGKYDLSPVSEAEFTFLQQAEGQELHHAEMPEAVRVECPPEQEDWLRAKFGTEFAAHMNVMLQNAPLDLRVNTLVTPLDGVIKSLAKEQITAVKMAHSPWGLRIEGKANVLASKAFGAGWIDIQDEGSQLIAMLCDARPGQQVMDYCAGAGGKTLALAAVMENKGRIVAMDIDAKRLEKAKLRFRKAGIHNIEIRPLSDPAQQKWLRKQKEHFDCVLVDAPCSSSGTWQRNPDLRWRPLGPSLDELLKLQAEILDATAPVVKQGGHLVYATCSINPAENEVQIDRFLTAHPEFSLTNEVEFPYNKMQEKGFFARKLIKKAP